MYTSNSVYHKKWSEEIRTEKMNILFLYISKGHHTCQRHAYRFKETRTSEASYFLKLTYQKLIKVEKKKTTRKREGGEEGKNAKQYTDSKDIWELLVFQGWYEILLSEDDGGVPLFFMFIIMLQVLIFIHSCSTPRSPPSPTSMHTTARKKLVLTTEKYITKTCYYGHL